jgi:DNA invertase Pin-like site-specific DNA recombinase
MQRQPWDGNMSSTRRRPARRDISDLTDLRAGMYCRVSQDRDGTEKSTEDQEAEGRRWAERQHVLLAEVYRDNDRSASRFATRQREDFTRMMADLAAGKLDVLWFWELSRSQRRLDVFAKLRDLSRDMGVLWVIRDRVYDPGNYADMMTLGMLSVIGENESEMTSQRVLRGKASSAASGRPLGRVPYGYRRVYHPETRQLVRQEPDIFDGDDKAVQDSPAGVVREIFDRIAAGDPVRRIVVDLNDRGIPSSTGGRWTHTVVLSTAKRRTYIGQQVHQGKVLEAVKAVWPPLIEPETFWAVQRVLSDPARRTSRPARARHLLSNQIRCAECGGRMRVARTTRAVGTGDWYDARGHRPKREAAPCLDCGQDKPSRSRGLCAACYMRHHRAGSLDAWPKLPPLPRPPRPPVPPGGWRSAVYMTYQCTYKACTGISVKAMDEYAEEVIIRWLSDPDVCAQLSDAGDSAEAMRARADAEQLRGELAQLYRDIDADEVSAIIGTRREKVLQERITEADSRAQSATLPPVLRGNIGPKARAGWAGLDLAVKRQIIAAVADIRVVPVGRGRKVHPADRIEWRWLLGPDAEQDS